MRRENRILISTGLALVAVTMFFGFYYAVFDEHQTLAGMGVAMMNGFVEAARGDMAASSAALDQLGVIAKEYKREIHFHGHWGFLSVLLLLFGLVIHSLNLGEAARARLALLLATSAVLFPFGVVLQILSLELAGSVLAILGTAGLVVGMLIFTVGVLGRQPTN